MEKITGGCLCGSIRYEADAEILRAYNCHCRDCQYLSGTGHLSLLAIREAGFSLSGELRYFEKTGASGGKVSLGFCPNCGSNILGKPVNLPGLIALAAGSLDDSNLFKPAIDIFTASAPAWDQLSPDTAKFAGLPG